jgi:hypothetical protein
MYRANSPSSANRSGAGFSLAAEGFGIGSKRPTPALSPVCSEQPASQTSINVNASLAKTAIMRMTSLNL